MAQVVTDLSSKHKAHYTSNAKEEIMTCLENYLMAYSNIYM
jgi:hypothetical protein